MVIKTQIELSETVDMNIGSSILIIGTCSDELIESYYTVYKPIDKYDCREAYEDTSIARTYWEIASHGVKDISCVSIPSVSIENITTLFEGLDQYSFDIILIPEVISSNYVLVKLLSDYATRYASSGKGFVLVISPPNQGPITDYDYCDKLLFNTTRCLSPYIVIPVGTIMYNTNSMFQYITNCVGAMGGLLGSLSAGVNHSYKTISGVIMQSSFTDAQITNLCDKGYATLIYSISKGVCFNRAVTTEGHEYFNVSHTRIANIINKALSLTLNKYIGNAISLGSIHETIDATLAYYSSSLYRDCGYTLTQEDNGRLNIDLSILPNDTIQRINSSLVVTLRK